MLAIQMRATPLGKIRWRQWYIGEPTPTDIGRVVTFQADGDELNLFLDAMAASNGFVVKKPEPLKKKQYRIMYEPNFENDFDLRHRLELFAGLGLVLPDGLLRIQHEAEGGVSK